MKNIYKKINISPLFLILILLSLISGLFKDIISLFLIIIIHEIGHIITSLFYKWDIDKININIYGGYITYNENIDKPFKEEFIIAISGVLMQSVFFIIMCILNKINIVQVDTLLMIKKYHYSILIFNLLPVIPLDGAKVLNIFFNLFFPYRKSLNLTNYVSLTVVFIFVLLSIIFKFKVEFSYLIILSFIISSIFRSIIDTPFLFNKFLFERYKHPIRCLGKSSYVKNGNINNIMRQKKNYFYVNGSYKDERYLLTNRYKVYKT